VRWCLLSPRKHHRIFYLSADGVAGGLIVLHSKLTVALVLIALAMSGCASLPSDGGGDVTLVVLHAGSLSVPVKGFIEAYQQDHRNVTFLTEAAGSRTTARKVSELGREADLVLSADYLVLDELLIPDFAGWNIRFARNEMVIAYTASSRYADEITSENWYEILLRPDVVYGHSDPNADPCGYRTLMVWQLAERHYGIAGLSERLDEHCPPENVRPKETDLIALLESGDMDYAFEYRSVAIQHGLNYVTLPPEINLSEPQLADAYREATVEVSGREPGTTTTLVAVPIVYGLTIPRNAPHPDEAQAFVRFILGPEGQAILEEAGQSPLVPPLATGEVPAELADLVERVD